MLCLVSFGILTFGLSKSMLVVKLPSQWWFLLVSLHLHKGGVKRIHSAGKLKMVPLKAQGHGLLQM